MPPNPHAPIVGAGIAFMLGVVFFWCVVVPFCVDAIEWIFNIGRRRK